MKYSLALILILLCACTPAKRENKQIKHSENKITHLKSPAGTGSEEPFLFTGSDGSVYLSWIEAEEKLKKLKFSILEEKGWSEPTTIATGSNWFVNWADFPVISVNTKNEMIAHFLAKSGNDTFTYDVNMVLSTDGGSTWSDPKVLHDDGKQAEHGFVTILPYEDNFFVTWLDGRNTVGNSHADTNTGHGGAGAMTIRAAIVSPSGEKLNEWELDERVCDCCQTSAAITANGPVVVYRDRSEQEIRDVSIVRLIDGNWTSPQTIFANNWKIAGCPVNGPKAAVVDNNLAIAWFSAPEDETQVNLIFSEDGGATFSKPIRIDEGKSVGRVDVALLDTETAIVSWMEGSEIKTVKATSAGKIGKSLILASTSESRASGFPQISRSGNKLVFAWTDSENKQVMTGYLEI